MNRLLLVFIIVLCSLTLLAALRSFLAESEEELARTHETGIEAPSEATRGAEARRFDPGPGSGVVDISSPSAMPDEILDGPRRLLRVVGPDGEPVAGAAVHFVGRRRVEAYTKRESRSIGPAIAALAPRIGTSDERGELSFRAPRGDGLIVALEGELFGKRQLGEGGAFFDLDSMDVFFSGTRSSTRRFSNGIITLRLRAFDLVDVEVVDSAGKPLGMMPLKFFDPREIAARYRRPWDEVAMTSKTEGRARILVPRSANEEDDCAVQLAGFFLEPLLAPIEQRHLAGETLTFEAPAWGSVMIGLVDEEGRRLADPGELGFGLANRRLSMRDFDFRGGRQVVMPVGLDCRLAIRLGLLDHSRSRTLVEYVDGPIVAGETLQVDLVLEPHRLFATARCLGPDGRLLGDQEIQGYFGQSWALGRSDETGQVSYGLDDRLRRSSGEIELIFRWMRSGRIAGEIRRLIDLPSDGEVDLGELRFDELPLLVAGRIVDDRGLGLGGVSARVVVFDASRMRSFPNRLGTSNTNESISDKEGRFEVLGLGDGPDLRVTVEVAGHVSQEIVVPRGTTDLRIEAPRLARLRGRIVAPSGLENRALEIWFQDDEGKRERAGETEFDGRFDLLARPGRHAALRAALPGPIAADMRLDALRAETLREDLTLPPGETTDIGEQQITFPARFLRIEILGARLLPTRDAHLVIEDVETGIVCKRLPFNGRPKELEVVVPRFPVELAIKAPGIRFERLRVATTEATLVVRPCTRLRVQVLDFEGLRHDHDVTLLLTDEDGMGDVETTIKLDRQGRGEVLIPTEGPHSVVLRVHKMFGTWNDEYVQVIPDSPESLQVLAGSSDQRVRIRLPEGALVNASQSLREE